MGVVNIDVNDGLISYVVVAAAAVVLVGVGGRVFAGVSRR